MMMILTNRRAALVAVVNTMLSLSGDIHWYDGSTLHPTSLEDFICTYTPKAYRDAVAATGKFLYRGESSLHKPTILFPEPDLLVADTYDDPGALIYFQCLEKRLKSSEKVLARPSLGHIGTSDKIEAARWGEPVTIWPIGGTLSFVWPRHEKVFFPSPTHCPSDELAVDYGLALALELGHEVLFATVPPNDNEAPKSPFLAVPAQYELALVELAKKPEFISTDASELKLS